MLSLFAVVPLLLVLQIAYMLMSFMCHHICAYVLCFYVVNAFVYYLCSCVFCCAYVPVCILIFSVTPSTRQGLQMKISLYGLIWYNYILDFI